MMAGEAREVGREGDWGGINRGVTRRGGGACQRCESRACAAGVAEKTQSSDDEHAEGYPQAR